MLSDYLSFKELQQDIKARLTLLETQVHSRTSDGTFNIYKLKGESQLGEPYEYSINFISPHKLEVEALVDTDVKIELSDAKDIEDHRVIFGKVFQAKEENIIADKYVYSLKVVHPLYYLKTTKRYEIYQDMSAMEIIQQIIKQYAGLLDLHFLSSAPPRKTREYTTQYQQSDLAFIQMLCQEEGVTLNLQGDKLNKDWGEDEKFVIRLENISDSYRTFKRPLESYYNLSKTFQATHQEEDYYDFKAPSHNYAKTSGAIAKQQTLQDNPKTAQLRNDLKQYRLRDRLEVERSGDLSRYTREDAIQEYAHSEKVYGRSQSLLTCDGHAGTIKEKESHRSIEALITKVSYEGFFPNALEEHVSASLNAGTSAMLSASKEEVKQTTEYQFETNFEAVPLTTTYIAPKTIQKPRIYSTVTARVSGGQSVTELQSNEDTVDVDKQSRVRVIFHFDPKYPTSCYMRFANFWSGNGWGSQFIPRVNTEVIVSFINGDPDRPHIIGSLYNNENQIPQALPANKTQSYIKTRSMPGSPSEYNLLLFEDKQKQDLVHIRAQKDYKLHALHNSYINIDNDQTEVVGNDESITIGHDRTESVGNDETVSIGNDQSNTIGNDQTNHIIRNQIHKIDKDKITKIGNHRQDDIFANYKITTGGHYKQTTNGEQDLKAGTHIKSITKDHVISGNEKVIFKGPGGTIIIDGGNITLKGKVTIKGSLDVSGGSAEAVEMLELEANIGDDICLSCLLGDDE
jgi:type VI secretion system secreted protein VgrG